MTERAQPGAVKSLVRNDELAQILGQLTGGFDDGWVADPADPTPASTRRSDIDESAFDGFALSNVSASSLSVDVGPGEGFAGGWVAIDTTTTVSLPANTTSTIVAAMDLDAVYDPNSDPDRDAADRVVIDIAANVSDDLPRVRLHEATTDGSGVTGTTDLRKPYGPALEADSATVGTLEANILVEADIANASENQILVTQGDGTLSVETQAEGPNPYDEAQTFTESDVTVTNNKTISSNGSITLLNEIIIEDFEDGDITVKSNDWTGWSGDTGSLNATTGTVISGSYSGELVAPNNFKAVSTTSTTGGEFNPKITLEIGSDIGDSSGDCGVEFFGPNGRIALIEFADNNGNVEEGISGIEILPSWDAGVQYNLEFNINYDTNELDVIVNGSTQATDIPFSQNNNELDNIQVFNQTSATGATRSLFFDDIYYGENESSGDAIIEWDRGIPTDIFSWDVATFTRTLDSETVDVFVAYSSDGGSSWTRTNSGNPISRNYSLNEDQNITPSVDVRIEADLSRSDTANNPSLDSAYRSWFI